MFISILGDSISTYKDVSNDRNANQTLGINPYFYCAPFPLEKTYWMRVIQTFGLDLCVNNSWSGGNLSGIGDESAGVNRAKHLSRDDGTVPDLVILFMGINDLGRGVNLSVFATDYEQTLKKIQAQYPQAFICCVNLPDRDPYFKPRTEAFNQAIDAAIERVGARVFVADLFHSRLNNDNYYMNTVDGLHPDEDGMKIIAEVVEDAIRRHCPAAK